MGVHTRVNGDMGTFKEGTKTPTTPSDRGPFYDIV